MFRRDTFLAVQHIIRGMGTPTQPLLQAAVSPVTQHRQTHYQMSSKYLQDDTKPVIQMQVKCIAPEHSVNDCQEPHGRPRLKLHCDASKAPHKGGQAGGLHHAGLV